MKVPDPIETAPDVHILTLETNLALDETSTPAKRHIAALRA